MKITFPDDEAVVTTLAPAKALDPRRENVHPLLDPIRFAPGIDYYGVIYPSALLATRLMNSPQGLQHDYCFFYGKSSPANEPKDYDYSKFKRLPSKYACDKAIGELDETDIRHVKHQRLLLAERVRFRVTDLGPDTAGGCQPCYPEKGIRGTISVIAISKTLIYDKILAPDQTTEDKICLQFFLACTLLHELAHAANHHLFGGDAFEDFRENSIVSEAGSEYESRIFGQRPQFFLDAPNPNYRVTWGIWQSRGGLEGAYDTDKVARNAWQMPANPQLWADGLDFVTKLSDDTFWEAETGEYAERGAFALIPKSVARCCASGATTNMGKSIPLSIKDLFREGGPSYAKKKYARFVNPFRKLRGPVEYDNCRSAIL